MIISSVCKRANEEELRSFEISTSKVQTIKINRREFHEESTSASWAEKSDILYSGARLQRRSL
jgi:hypothetical protein